MQRRKFFTVALILAIVPWFVAVAATTGGARVALVAVGVFVAFSAAGVAIAFSLRGR